MLFRLRTASDMGDRINMRLNHLQFTLVDEIISCDLRSNNYKVPVN